MNIVTRFIAVAILSLVVIQQSRAQYTDLLSLSDTASPLSSPSFTFAAPATTGSQTASGLVVNGSVVSGDNIYLTLSAPQNWSSYNFGAGPNVLSLFMNTSAPNPDISITLELLDGVGNVIDKWSGDTGTSAFSGYLDLAISDGGTADYSDVGSYFINFNNFSAASINTTMSQIAVVPEPSTYALLALSGLAFGGYVIRRRRRA